MHQVLVLDDSQQYNRDSKLHSKRVKCVPIHCSMCMVEMHV